MPLLSTSSLSFFVPTLCPCCYTFFVLFCFFSSSQWSSQVVICIIVLERQFLRRVTAISYTLGLFHRFSFTFQCKWIRLKQLFWTESVLQWMTVYANTLEKIALSSYTLWLSCFLSHAHLFLFFSFFFSIGSFAVFLFDNPCAFH